MRGLFRGLFALITFPFKLVWKVRKLIFMAGAAFGALTGWKKFQETQGKD